MGVTQLKKKGLALGYLHATIDYNEGIFVSEDKQTNPGRTSLVIGASVLVASVFCISILINFLDSSSPDIWAPFILLFYGFAGVAFIVSIVGLVIGIGQVVSQRKKGSKPKVAAIAGIVLNSLVISTPVFFLLIGLIQTNIQKPKPAEIPSTPSVLTIQSQPTQDAIQSSAENVVRGYIEMVLVNDWNSASRLFLSPDSNDQDRFLFVVERCSNTITSGVVIDLWEDENKFGILTYKILTDDTCTGIILVQHIEGKYFIYTVQFSIH